MNHKAFQLNKVRRFINTHGQIFQFDKPGKNEFGEPNGETVSHEVKGVFHETSGSSSGYVAKTSGDSTTVRTKSNPQFLTLWESVGPLQHQDKLTFNDKTYKVTEITNLLQANLIAEISLEEVQGP